ncbi:DUF4190 domain-containing protein [Occultella aeris]|uniref:DUF4190 domain-containing protein n=1 Tax=Occultella aeris TaxID=2761496 RepID=A0A7M4DQW3_9MICO|nr:DUF4190 domain-containing protein [Occultella aeris]VZO39857.1 hypothetical protein HALOF300_04554 [Occultella aeris]
MSYPPVPPSSGGVNPYESQDPYGAAGSNPVPSHEDRAFVEGPQPWDPQVPGSYGQSQYGAQPQYGAQSQYGAQQYGQPQSPYGVSPYGYGLAASHRNSLGTTALVLGIVGFFLACIPLVGIGLGIGAIVNGNKGRLAADAGQATNRGSATGGLVMGVLAIIAGVFWILVSLSQGFYG